MSGIAVAGRKQFHETLGKQPFRLMLILTMIAAITTCLAFPPFEFALAAWLGLVPFFLALTQVRPMQGFILGWIFGAILIGWSSAFIALFGLLPLAAMALLFGLFYALFGLCVAGIARLQSSPMRILTVAAAWALCEMARGYFGPLAYTYGDLVYTQHALTPIIQIASLAGPYSVSFLIALLAAGLANMLQAFMPMSWYRPVQNHIYFTRMTSRALLAVYVVIFVAYAWGSLVIRSAPADNDRTTPVITATVQPNSSMSVPAKIDELNEEMATYMRMTAELDDSVQLIVWSETAVAKDLNEDLAAREQVANLAINLNSFMLIGALERENGKLYNSAYLFAPDGLHVDTYRKIDLVAFGEYVPFRDQLPFLKRYPIRSIDFAPGTERKLMSVHDLQISPLICFEAIFPGPTRECTRLGADVIAILNSDTWASRGTELLHNSYTAPLRAAEARRYVVRASSTGISGIYDPYGRLVQSVSANEEGTAIANIYAAGELSTYHKYGEMPLLVMCIMAIVAAYANRRTNDACI